MKRQTSNLHIFVSLLLLVLAPYLYSGELTYDKAGLGTGSGIGALSDFNVNTADDSPYLANIWLNPGFIGRLDYQGEPAEFIFTSLTPARLPKFAFVFLNANGTYNTGRYREFFLVVRAKGLYHNGGQYNFTSQNIEIINSGEGINLSQGAGTEPAVIGQTGYNTSGGSGICAEGNAYQYKYPFKYIWIDVTLIRTNTSSGTSNRGYYEAIVSVTAQNYLTKDQGANYTLQLSGKNNPRLNTADPWNFYFGVENLLPSSFPFSMLSDKNMQSNALPVGKVRYFSTDDTASLKLSSNNLGTAVDFRLVSPTNQSIQYSLVYTPTRGNGVETLINSPSNSFTSQYYTLSSPIGGATEGNYIEGTTKIFVAPNLLPLSGTYTSNIYCILTRTN